MPSCLCGCWYDFHISFRKQVAFYQTPRRSDTSNQTRTYVIFFPLCLRFTLIPLFSWFMERRDCCRDRVRGESIRCRIYEMIRWNLNSRRNLSLSLSFSLFLISRINRTLLYPSNETIEKLYAKSQKTANLFREHKNKNIANQNIAFELRFRDNRSMNSSVSSLEISSEFMDIDRWNNWDD